MSINRNLPFNWPDWAELKWEGWGKGYGVYDIRETNKCLVGRPIVQIYRFDTSPAGWRWTSNLSLSGNLGKTPFKTRYAALCAVVDYLKEKEVM